MHDARIRYGVFALLSIAVFASAGVMAGWDASVFRDLLGDANPLLVVAVAFVLGTGVLCVLESRWGFDIIGPDMLRGIAVSSALVVPLAVSATLLDLHVRFPVDMNVPWPKALLYYPVMGYIAEVAFHLVPLAILLVVLSPLRTRVSADRLVWIAIIVTAVSEPTFQVALSGNPLVWEGLHEWAHIFVIALAQLWVFRRFGFMTMFGFRLLYYAYWHLAWGTVRLELLF
jgi:hypothetical protein